MVLVGVVVGVSLVVVGVKVKVSVVLVPVFVVLDGVMVDVSVVLMRPNVVSDVLVMVVLEDFVVVDGVMVLVSLVLVGVDVKESVVLVMISVKVVSDVFAFASSKAVVSFSKGSASILPKAVRVAMRVNTTALCAEGATSGVPLLSVASDMIRTTPGSEAHPTDRSASRSTSRSARCLVKQSTAGRTEVWFTSLCGCDVAAKGSASPPVPKPESSALETANVRATRTAMAKNAIFLVQARRRKH